MKRLVYLPDPTIKFYYSVGDKDVYCDTEANNLETDNGFKNSIFIEACGEHAEVVLNMVLNRLEHSPLSREDYFPGLLGRDELFAIVEVGE